MKASELRDLSEEEILEKERETKEELFNLRFQHATGQLENTMRVRHVRRDLARVKTLIHEQKRMAPEIREGTNDE